MAATDKPRVGLALGSGSARGWAHIGVIRALESWVLELRVSDVVGFLDVSLGGGAGRSESC
jgi:NTE family protein